MKIIVHISLLVFTLYGFSQEPKKNSKQVTQKDKMILVVPFNTNLYNNEASKEMIETSGLQYKQVQNFMRIELDRNLHKAIADSCKSRSLLQSYTTQSDWDELEYIYANTDYFFADAMSFEINKKQLSGKSKIASDKEDEKKTKKKKDEKDKLSENGDLRSNVKNNPDKFLNVKFREKDFLKNLAKRSNVDFFLFINQFEIKGDYSDPYASGNYGNNWEIKANFSIFNHNGDYLFGSYATMDFPATENDLQKISDEYFSKLAKEIIKRVPF